MAVETNVNCAGRFQHFKSRIKLSNANKQQHFALIFAKKIAPKSYKLKGEALIISFSNWIWWINYLKISFFRLRLRIFCLVCRFVWKWLLCANNSIRCQFVQLRLFGRAPTTQKEEEWAKRMHWPSAKTSKVYLHKGLEEGKTYVKSCGECPKKLTKRESIHKIKQWYLH